ncbi:MAG: cupin domain-containing protein [Chloroflexota bacterium]|nr:cupin domain-containing protein [Chloroflexota bacterium]
MSDIRVIKPHERDAGTAQTAGMTRFAGVSARTAGASGVWMGEAQMEPGFRSGAHHHGEVESAIYVVSGAFRMRWGNRLEHSTDADPGDFIFVPAMLVHQEVNASDREPLVVIVARGGQENIVVNVEVRREHRSG